MKKNQTLIFERPPVIESTASIVGSKEGEGPLQDYFDLVSQDALFGEASWEKAESRFVEETMKMAVQKAGKTMEDIDFLLAGDLLNQTMGTSFGVRQLNRPFFGLFGACSTFGEALTLGSVILSGGFGQRVLCGASSHFAAAEKTFRFPLPLGTQRPPTSSWTVTGAGCALLSSAGNGPVVTAATVGKIVDMGITDANNMGAAMAPAAVDTLLAHFEATGTKPADYDAIATGDLGYIGHELVVKLMAQEGIDMGENYTDCGIEVFNKHTQDTHSGGSGCACAAVTFSGYFYQQLKEEKIKSILLIPTGALLSPISTQQGESIPGIAHAVSIQSAATI